MKSNLNQAQTLEPKESSALRHPQGQLVKAISLITRKVHSVAQDDIYSLGTLHSGAPPPSPLSWVLHLDTAMQPNEVPG